MILGAALQDGVFQAVRGKEFVAEAGLGGMVSSLGLPRAPDTSMENGSASFSKSTVYSLR